MADTQITPQQVTNDDEQLALFAMQLASASVLPMVLKTALDLDLLEIMAKKSSPMSPIEIASQLRIENPNAPVMLDRILRLLSSYSILICSGGYGVERTYELGPVCKYLTKNDDGVSIAALCHMNQDEVLMKSWYHLKDAIRNDGIPFNKAHEEMTSFDYHETDHKFNMVFNNGMSNHSTITMKKILETYKGFEGLTSLVDVGGGIGATLKVILSKYPNLKGINFDLLHVIKNATPHDGIQHVEGDMFKSVPEGDAIFMKWICHDWSDNKCVQLLQNCYKALPENGIVILAECLLPETIDTTSLFTKQVFHVDCIMLAHNPGGKERTEKEFEELANASGFKGIKVVCNAFGVYIIELLKKID
ncbi:unnamed protein product [Brassica rapa]|uniref:O-methyltransferase domain-containing protein n=1 Tax=Brassica campestris TaxID=3711 RepID=A0A3P6A3R3_BRACM|nr:unnamed protein product [Brassica rapa]VDC87032.1 unnamed protein product [Brassica rapa]